MHPTEFIYSYVRAVPAGAAEAAPANAAASGVFHLRTGAMDSVGRHPKRKSYDTLLMLATQTFNYEVLLWQRRAAAPYWVSVATGTLTANVPAAIPFPYEGSRIYIRKTSATGSDGFVMCQPEQAGSAITASVILAGVVKYEDTPAVSGDPGIQALAVRNDSAATVLTSTNGDYSGIAVDDRGVMFTRPSTVAGTSNIFPEDTAHVTGDLGAFILSRRADNPSSSAGSDGDYAAMNTDATGHLYSRDRTYDSATNSNRQAEASPLDSHFVAVDLSQTTTVAGSVTTDQYVDMAGFGPHTIEYCSLVGTNTKTLTIWATNVDDGTAPASIAAADWVDISNYYGAASWTAAQILIGDQPLKVKYIRTRVITAAGGANDNTWKLLVRKAGL